MQSQFINSSSPFKPKQEFDLEIYCWSFFIQEDFSKKHNIRNITKCTNNFIWLAPYQVRSVSVCVGAHARTSIWVYTSII